MTLLDENLELWELSRSCGVPYDEPSPLLEVMGHKGRSSILPPFSADNPAIVFRLFEVLQEDPEATVVFVASKDVERVLVGHQNVWVIDEPDWRDQVSRTGCWLCLAFDLKLNHPYKVADIELLVRRTVDGNGTEFWPHKEMTSDQFNEWWTKLQSAA